MNDSLKRILLYSATCLLAGALLGAYFRPPVQETTVVTRWRTKVVTEVKEVEKIVTKDVVKWRERTTTKPDGTTIVEVCRIGESSTSSSQEVTNTTSSEEEKVSVVTTKTTPLARYRIGLGSSLLAVTEPYDLGNYRLTGEARIGDWPVWAGVWVQGDLSFGVGLSYEF